VLVIDREIPDIAADIVLVDNFQGGYLATRHLIETGHRDIACIAGPSNLTPSNQRLVGYERALAESGIPLNEPWVVRGDFHAESGNKAVLQLLKMSPRPTAIFACNDMMAIGALHGAYTLKIQIPEELAIVGFDDIELASYVYPPLTSIAQPKEKIGKMAVDLIVERISTPDLPSRTVILESHLIKRLSSGVVGKEFSSKTYFGEKVT
jgi:LacI family transcriptional regulator